MEVIREEIESGISVGKTVRLLTAKRNINWAEKEGWWRKSGNQKERRKVIGKLWDGYGEEGIKVKWIERVKNDEVLVIIGEKRKLIGVIRKRTIP